MLDPIDPSAELHRAPAQVHPVPDGFPHLAGAEPRVLELLDQRLDGLAAGTADPERVQGGADEAEALDPLRRPVGRDLGGGHPPDLLGVGLEEDVEEGPAEAVDDPVFEAPLGLDRLGAGLQVAGEDPGRGDRAELLQGVDRTQGVVKELAIVVDPAQPRAAEELIGEDLVPEGVDLGVLGEEPMAADVEAVALVNIRPTDPADEVRVGLDDDAAAAVLRQLVGGGQAGGAGAGDDGLERLDDGLSPRILDAMPAMRRKVAPRGRRPRLLAAHAGLPIREDSAV